MNAYSSSEQRFFIGILASMIITDGNFPAIPDDLDWERLYSLARRHDLSGMAFIGLNNHYPNCFDSVYSRFKKDYEISLFYEVKRQVETENILRRFDEHKIPSLPLKGFVFKNYYPSPEWRTMGDIDLLVDREYFNSAKSVLESEGFKQAVSAETNYSFYKPGFGTLELHYHFYHSLSKAFHKSFPEFYRNEQVWNRLTKPSSGYQYSAGRFDLFFMFFLHLVKHFLSRGIGVRYILDYILLKRHYSLLLSEPEISFHLNELNLRQFANNIDRLSSFWFEKGESDRVIDKLSAAILENAVHGDNLEAPKMLVTSFVKNNDKLNSASKFRFILHRFFPNRTGMAEHYSILYKHPGFLPVCYAHRILCNILDVSKWRHFCRLLFSLARIDKKEIDSLSQFQTEMGLDHSKGNS